MTVLVVAVLVYVMTSSAGWPRFEATFLSWDDAKASFPSIAKGFWINVKLFCIAEPIILVVGILVAVTRSTVSPWLTPLRAAAVLYTDLLRGVPTLLVVVLLALGVPALRLSGV